MQTGFLSCVHRATYSTYNNVTCSMSINGIDKLKSSIELWLFIYLLCGLDLLCKSLSCQCLKHLLSVRTGKL